MANWALSNLRLTSHKAPSAKRCIKTPITVGFSETMIISVIKHRAPNGASRRLLYRGSSPYDRRVMS